MADLTIEIQRLERIVLRLITTEQRTRTQELELTYYQERLTLAGKYQQIYDSYCMI